jgi:hypothetical protein
MEESLSQGIEIELRLLECRIDAERPLEILPGLASLSQIPIGHHKVVERPGVVRMERDGPGEGAHGILGPALPLKILAEQP